MLVYGDRERWISPVERLCEIEVCLAEGSRECLSDAFVLASELAQGLIDYEFGRSGGEDDLTALHDAALRLLLDIARRLHGSRSTVDASLPALAGLQLPEAVKVRQAEGYAHYALYPDAYLAAAAELDGPATLIGLRSIGAGLAALVAAASGSDRLFSLRPVGEPFDRRLSVSPALESAILAVRSGAFAVVDEGPGLSGSSFRAVADWLEARGVAREAIVFFPSHSGDPGAASSDQDRARWRDARRLSVGFDTLFVEPDAADPLSAWFEDITGGPIAAMQDLSGGVWRDLHGSAPSNWPPAHTSQEKRKFLLHAEHGTFLLKFAGLGPEPKRKFARSRALHAAGFSPETLALRRGMLLQRWVAGEPLEAEYRGDLVAPLAAYLGFRATDFLEAQPGTSLRDLLAMAEQNITEAFGVSAAAAALAGLRVDRVDALQDEVRPVSIDGRLHAWEWLWVDGRLVKTDAVDHAEAHDLIGAQDIAWDIAGACVEFEWGEAELRRLLGGMAAKVRPPRDLVELLTPCYLGFQIGLWTFAAAADPDHGRPAALVARYGRCLHRHARAV